MSTLYVDNLQPNLGSRVMAAGHVVQVVQATSTTNLTVSSGGGGTTWNDAGAIVTITPTVASSKVLVLNSGAGIFSATVAGSCGCRILRNINGAGWNVVSQRARQGYSAALGGYLPINWDYNYLDSPNTTSSVQYKIQINMEENGNIRYNSDDGSYSPTTSESSLIVMEIAQ
jgi:hypothetical protein